MAAAACDPRGQEPPLIGEVKGRFDKTTSAVLLDYKGMTVEHVTKLRAEFRKAGVEYKVVKNTLVKQALKDTAYGGKLDDVLVGMTGIAWSYEDPSAAAKVVKAFKKDAGTQARSSRSRAGSSRVGSRRARRVENQLATMPGKDELRAHAARDAPSAAPAVRRCSSTLPPRTSSTCSPPKSARRRG